MPSFEEQLAAMKKAPLRRGGGSYLTGNGVYEVELISTQKKMGLNSTFTVRDKELFIAEFKIVKSTNPDHAAGTSASWTLKDPSTANVGDLKSFCIAAFGTDPRQVKESDDKAQQQAALLGLAAMGEAEAFKALKLEDDAFVGRRLGLETKVVTSSKTGKPFTRHIWTPGAEEEDAA